MSSQLRHESGKLKQANKKHKGNSKANSKRALGPGRTAEVVRGNSSVKHNSTAIEARNKRMGFDQQQKKQKRADMYLKKRIGSSHGPPKVIGIITLSDHVDVNEVFTSCLTDASWSSSTSIASVVHVEYAKHKTNVTFMFTPNNLTSVIEVAKICDSLLFIGCANPNEPESIIDSSADSMLSALRAVGLPESICYTQGLHTLSGKALVDMRKLSHRHFEAAIGTNVRYAEDTDTSMLIRHICAITPKSVLWRSTRSYMLCETAQIVDDVHALNPEGVCSVRLGGYLRGQPLNVQSLVHVFGATYAVSRISSALGAFDSKESLKHRTSTFSSHDVLSIPDE
jgi:hypothetical protein